jgi:2-hydroxychromene-2-carboxylate isomerase
VLSENSFDPDEVLALTADEEVKAILKDNTETAIKRGVFGAPSMFVDDQLYLWPGSTGLSSQKPCARLRPSANRPQSTA